MSKSYYIIPLFVPDLGCPHQCVFCNQKRITGVAGVPTAAQVRETISEYLATMPADRGITREVAFYGGSFTAVAPELQKELLAPAYRYLTEGKIDNIRVSTRPDAIDDETLALLSAYGVGTVELGVQSMDDEVLWKSGRGHTSRDVIRAAALIKTWGISLGVQMMVGLPGDTPEKDVMTADELIALNPDLVRIYPCLVLKETALSDAYDDGSYVPLTVDEAVARCKALLLMFEKAAINVIRIGLQPSEQINLEGDVIAGPYHPAFRELVESAVARDQLDYLLSRQAHVKEARSLVVAVPEQDISIVRGHRGSNTAWLREKYGVEEFATVADNSLQRGSIRLVSVDGQNYDYMVRRNGLKMEGLYGDQVLSG